MKWRFGELIDKIGGTIVSFKQNMADLAQDKMHLVLVNAVVEKNGKVLICQRSPRL